LAQTLARRRKSTEAAQELQTAERLLMGLTPDMANRPSTLMALVRIYNQMAQLRARPAVLTRGQQVANSKRSVEILTGLMASDPQNPDYRLAMAQCKLNQSQIFAFETGADAEQRSEEAIEMLQELVEDFPNNPTYQFALAETYSRTSTSRWMWGKPRTVRERVETAVALLTELADQYDHMPEYRSSLARTHARLGMFLMMAGDHAGALRELAASVAMQMDLADRYPSVPAYRFTLGWSEFMLARYHMRQKRFDDAGLLLEQVVDTTTGLLEVGHEPQLSLTLQSEAYECLAEVRLSQGNSVQAELMADLALQNRGKLAVLRRESGDDRGRGSQRGPRFGFPSFDGSRAGPSDGERRPSNRNRPPRDRQPSDTEPAMTPAV
jgi:tetratricopeptide (TPR) repeat protein